MNKPLRIVFMGTPDFSVPALKSLIASHHQVVAAYTQPPRPKGRGQQVQESPVHEAAKAAGIPVRHPANFKKDEDIAAFMALEPDVAVVAAYGLILPKSILEAPVHGCLNIHASLLPRWRGAAPIQRAILEGDDETGITVMQMDEGLDTGAMISKKAVPIRASTTAQSLHDILSALGSSMITEAMDRLSMQGYLDATPQPALGSTYAKMLKKEEGRIAWGKDAAFIHRQIRALNPWPGTWAELEGKRFKVLEAVPMPFHAEEPPGTIRDADGVVVCGGGSTIKLEVIQPENKKPMAITDAFRGNYLAVGQRFA
jgi:methionyl-tRNA formyltransferase